MRRVAIALLLAGCAPGLQESWYRCDATHGCPASFPYCRDGLCSSVADAGIPEGTVLPGSPCESDQVCAPGTASTGSLCVPSLTEGVRVCRAGCRWQSDCDSGAGGACILVRSFDDQTRTLLCVPTAQLTTRPHLVPCTTRDECGIFECLAGRCVIGCEGSVGCRTVIEQCSTTPSSGDVCLIDCARGASACPPGSSTVCGPDPRVPGRQVCRPTEW